MRFHTVNHLLRLSWYSDKYRCLIADKINLVPCGERRTRPFVYLTQTLPATYERRPRRAEIE